MPPGLSPLGQERSRKVKATYEVDHNKVIVGIAAAAPTGAIRVQAALERRPSLWGIWRMHLVQNKTEEGRGWFCALCASYHQQSRVLKGPNTGCKSVSHGACMAKGLCRNSDLPRKMTSLPVFLETLIDSRLTMGSAPSSSKFLGANMAKGMSKLVRVTCRDTGGSIRAHPASRLHASSEPIRSLPAQLVHRARLAMPSLRFPYCWRCPPHPPLPPTTCPQNEQGFGVPKTPGIQHWKHDLQ